MRGENREQSRETNSYRGKEDLYEEIVTGESYRTTMIADSRITKAGAVLTTPAFKNFPVLIT